MAQPYGNYRRTFEELEKVASKFWPSELSEQEAKLSIIPLLLETQDQFISILSIEVRDLDNLFDVVQASTLPANLFLKHLVILADFGGEPLQRVSSEFNTLFPEKKLSYIWRGEQRSYTFRALPIRSFNNKNLKIDGKKLVEDHPLDDLQKDAIAILLFGNTYSDDNQSASVLLKCEIGEYLGKPDQLTNFIKQRYIWVSRITGGAQSNSLGQIAQQFVDQYIKENINLNLVTINSSGRLPNVTHTDTETGRMTSFDLVVTNNSKYIAIEVSFQVTTNSTIERKSGQARSRYEQIQQAGHKIAYVIDGAGNIQRESALRNICSHSHCTVGFSRSELDVLCNFIKECFSS
ncbi:DpnII family type II restriction endonuclease [Gloeothece verrucosa]|uniref:Type II site-specific deoxyribonuclease n=1 Tax=Gloeothece verrucosa (strain PCC 7822) TaxID=497965 RepID=E0UGQ0_GLOV7|nr:DpnII family type II restriction endonuclease [Gloeothece verrucosa]ADN13259.1 Type II site-specific deoxyribonuclease [Gloeothece verrucosa PCC 7822]